MHGSGNLIAGLRQIENPLLLLSVFQCFSGRGPLTCQSRWLFAGSYRYRQQQRRKTCG
jgi:hypothetical protein